jgi:hypothetical protein
MEKIINVLIKEFIEGVDTYTHNGSTWLIFTERKQWVIELTEEKTLWYNYNFFKEIFEYTSMDVVENQQYITKWVESNIIKGLKEIKSDDFNLSQILCEAVIENGIKETHNFDEKHPLSYEQGFKKLVKDTIKNGVKETNSWDESIIGNLNQNGCVDNVIKNGTLETYEVDWDVPIDVIEYVINDGIKDTKVCNYTDPNTQLMWVKWGNQIEEVTENGVKKTKTPGEDGDIVGVLNFMTEHKTNNLPKLIDNVIENGVKKTSPLDPEFSVRFIDGDENNDWEMVPKINEVIENGVKETKGDASQNPMGKVTKIIKEGIKNPTG